MIAAAIIVAAGAGTRYGSAVPKQFLQLGSKPVWQWSYQAIKHHPLVGEIVVVIPDGCYNAQFERGVKTVIGGNTRTDSVLNGLKALSCPPNSPVLIHDAARPGLTLDIIDSLLAALKVSNGSAPYLPVNDALKRGTTNLATVDRGDLKRVQTPQAFRLGEIKEALQEAGESLVDDLEAIQRVGGAIKLIPGHERLAKITNPGDIAWMEKVLMKTETRTGTGFDVHAFEPGNHVTLCGVNIPHTASLKGHSDADAAWHALTDALLGALALGDIGDHFPPTDDKWKNAPSSVFLKHASKLAEETGATIQNVDITIICEAPKVKPHRELMRQSTADCLNIALDQVSVKATTTEGLGFTGRGEGLAAQASVTLAKNISRVG